MLLVSLLIILVAIGVLVITLSASQQNDREQRGQGSGGGFMPMPRIIFGPNLFDLFAFDYGRSEPRRSRRQSDSQGSLNFFEAVFSFLFGDGNPNRDLEERRWQGIATVIRQNQGAVTAEQIAPYLDDLGAGGAQTDENYMLPVLSRYNGIPQVDDRGGIVYHFPELQVMASQRPVGRGQSFLHEFTHRFSQASATQILLAVGLGGVNLIGALVLLGWIQDPALVQEVLGSLVASGAGQETAALVVGFISFVQNIFWFLFSYGVAFLAIPLGRYLWLQRLNQQVAHRNQQRQQRAQLLATPSPDLKHKLTYATQFAEQTILDSGSLAYTTERDLTEQEVERREQLDQEWRQRLEGYS